MASGALIQGKWVPVTFKPRQSGIVPIGKPIKQPKPEQTQPTTKTIKQEKKEEPKPDAILLFV